jgi:hypothetical protein
MEEVKTVVLSSLLQNDKMQQDAQRGRKTSLILHIKILVFFSKAIFFNLN